MQKLGKISPFIILLAAVCYLGYVPFDIIFFSCPTSSLNEYVDNTWIPVSKDSFTYLDINNRLMNCPLKDDLAEMYQKNA